jgi:undecaprenyl-diphosphatase
LFIIIILSIVQGMTELLPVSSSAHVILLEKLFGLNPSSPSMTFLLVMLHTGTMFAVLIYFWREWIRLLSVGNPGRNGFIKMLIISTAATAVIGLGFMLIIEKVVLRGSKDTAVESLFGNVFIIGASLAASGILIILSGLYRSWGRTASKSLIRNSLLVGIAQGLALPFRGFSRSGATISTALICGFQRSFSEELSFALSVILTPFVIIREFIRLHHIMPATGLESMPYLYGVLGTIFSFFSGLLALRWLSSWLERGKWWVFGVYCLFLSAMIFILASASMIT